jgi:hypothetical protein
MNSTQHQSTRNFRIITLAILVTLSLAVAVYTIATHPVQNLMNSQVTTGMQPNTKIEAAPVIYKGEDLLVQENKEGSRLEMDLRSGKSQPASQTILVPDNHEGMNLELRLRSGKGQPALQSIRVPDNHEGMNLEMRLHSGPDQQPISTGILPGDTTGSTLELRLRNGK